MKSEQTIYLSAKEVSLLLGVSPQTLRNWFREGKLTEWGIHPVKRNNRWYYSRSEIRKALNL